MDTIQDRLNQTRIRAVLHVSQGKSTTVELAQLTNYSQPHLCNVLVGRRRLTPRLGDALNEALDHLGASDRETRRADTPQGIGPQCRTGRT